MHCEWGLKSLDDLCRGLYEHVKVQLMGMDDVKQGADEHTASRKASNAEQVLKSLSTWNWKSG